MKRVSIPFYARFERPMLDGVKVCTARTSKKGNVGDRFTAWGAEFEITEIQMQTPDDIARMLWKQEGCTSEADFRSVWKKIHPRRDIYRNVYLHWFRRVKP